MITPRAEMDTLLRAVALAYFEGRDPVIAVAAVQERAIAQAHLDGLITRERLMFSMTVRDVPEITS